MDRKRSGDANISAVGVGKSWKDAETLIKLLESIEELDDVQKVEANFDMDVSEMAKA